LSKSGSGHRSLPRNIRKTTRSPRNTSHDLARDKGRRLYFDLVHADRRGPRTRLERHVTDLDLIDRKIVAELMRDATLPIAQIAEKTGLSRTPCGKRS